MNRKLPQSLQTTPVVAGIVLAAGQGTRMRSVLPKVLHPVMGVPMVEWVLRSLAAADVKSCILVVGEEHAAFQRFFEDHPELTLAVQVQQRGTADAVASVQAAFGTESPPVPYAQGRLIRGGSLEATHVLICAGDTPALKGAELARFIAAHKDSDIAVLGMQPEDPKGYGRLVLKEGALAGIVEERDADLETRQIRIVNSGVILARKDILFDLLAQVTPQNAQGEYYLTDIVRLGYEKGYVTRAHIALDAREFAGVNDRSQLAAVEAWMLKGKRDDVLAKGVSLHLPETIYIEADVEMGVDTDVAPGAVFYGQTTVGKGCRIGAGACLRDVAIGDGAVVGEGAVLVGGAIAAGATISPRALCQV